MKQALIIILFCSLPIGVNFAQENTPNVYYLNPLAPLSFKTLNMNVVDSGNVKFFYALNATDISKPETYDDLQCLEIGFHLSKYFSFYVSNSDSLVSDWVKKNPNVQDDKIPKQLGDKGKFEGWSEYIYSEYYKDFSKNELTEYARMPQYLDKYNAQYSESIPVQKWVVSDDTLTVAGYLCQKATCMFRGREYIAWFTMDILISNGPWKFGGLPGLMLKVYDRDKLYNFECVGIENHKQKYPIQMNKIFEQFKKTDRQKLWKTKKEVQEDWHKLLMAASGSDYFVVGGIQLPYNPLELE